VDGIVSNDEQAGVQEAAEQDQRNDNRQMCLLNGKAKTDQKGQKPAGTN